MSFQLRPASKVQLKARVALVGPSGAGKTYSALEAALALCGDISKVAVIDTERGSAALYADEFGEFLHGVIDPPFAPARYLEALEACTAAGAEVVIIDSLSHAWSGQGGVLEIVDDAAARSRGNSFAAWREGTPEQNRLVDTVMRWPGHVIVTMRAKTEYVVEEGDNGRTQVRKLGLAPEQRKGMEYEFDLVADVDHEHRLMVSKSRCAPLQDAVERKPDRAWWQPFAEWLNRGDTVQQQVTSRLDEIGFTSGQQAFIVGRYQDGAAAPGDLTGANAGKLLVHLGDEGALKRIRAALLSDDNHQAVEPDDSPADGEGDGEVSDPSAGATDSDVPPTSDHVDDPPSSTLTVEDTAAAASPTVAADAPSAGAVSSTGFDWQQHARDRGVTKLDVMNALRANWERMRPGFASEDAKKLPPNKSTEIDAWAAGYPEIVRAVIDDVADPKAVA
ncbi:MULTISPECIES: ATP-binding protein [unclassified Egicoccus]|uniref:ATP-binding protein n=1 Tax=unclassified Egicoccus TaxID=2635606 RepID=UPI00359EE06D